MSSQQKKAHLPFKTLKRMVMNTWKIMGKKRLFKDGLKLLYSRVFWTIHCGELNRDEAEQTAEINTT